MTRRGQRCSEGSDRRASRTTLGKVGTCVNMVGLCRAIFVRMSVPPAGTACEEELGGEGGSWVVFLHHTLFRNTSRGYRLLNVFALQFLEK